MSKKKDKAGKAQGAGKIPKRIAGFKLSKDVRKTGEALMAQAKSPAAQAVLAKGLTVAAGLATAAAERNRQAQAAKAPTPGESGEGAASPASAAPIPPIDAAKVVEAVQTVADVVMGRLFRKR